MINKDNIILIIFIKVSLVIILTGMKIYQYKTEAET